jgi:DNA processing protein
MIAVPRIGPKLAAAIRTIDLDQTRAAIRAWTADGIAVLLRESVDPGYPSALRTMDDAPPVLFGRGNWSGDGASDSRAIAIVGARQPSLPATQLATELAAELAAHGWTIVSGLAAGIDTAAHTGALEAGGRTVAVLGSGVRVIYPPQNADLAARIMAQGAIFSEQHPDSPPNSPALVARNRLISGLSRAVIVVEAGESSGSLHAARFARAQGRRVFAVESPARGNQRLIGEGAQPMPPDVAVWEPLLRTID